MNRVTCSFILVWLWTTPALAEAIWSQEATPNCTDFKKNGSDWQALRTTKITDDGMAQSVDYKKGEIIKPGRIKPGRAFDNTTEILDRTCGKSRLPFIAH